MPSAQLLTGLSEPIPDEAMIFAHDLRKSYGAVEAIKGIDLDVRQGEIFGLIGPDGAGKTSTFHIMGGVMEATSGEVRVCGRKPRDARLDIGYLTQQFSLYPDLSIDENIKYIAGLREVADEDFLRRKERYLKTMDLAQSTLR